MRNHSRESNEARGASGQRDGFSRDARLEETLASFRDLRQPVLGRVGQGARFGEETGRVEAGPFRSDWSP